MYMCCFIYISPQFRLAYRILQLFKVKDSPHLVDDTTRGCQTNAGEYSKEYNPCRFLNNLYPMAMFRTNSGGVVTFM